MVKHFIGIAGALLGALAGAWMIVAPSALAYHPGGADWTSATYVSFWTGLGLTAVSVAGLALYALGLAGELRERGIIEPRSRKASETSDEHRAETNGSSTIRGTEQLAPLISEVLREMQQERRRTLEDSGDEHEKNNQDPAEQEGRVSQ